MIVILSHLYQAFISIVKSKEYSLYLQWQTPEPGPRGACMYTIPGLKHIVLCSYATSSTTNSGFLQEVGW